MAQVVVCSLPHMPLSDAPSLVLYCAAGTALGDPIEVGAIRAVFASASFPVRLTAAKSRLGHAEPAAGGVGMIHAAAQLGMVCGTPLNHLATLNSYVASLLTHISAAGQVSPHILRQNAAACHPHIKSGMAAPAAIGASSFAFQGTNAHAALSRGFDYITAATSSIAASNWRRLRCWYTVPSHHLLSRCLTTSVSSTTFSCNLGKASLAYLRDHKVAAVAVLVVVVAVEAAAAAAAVCSHRR